jgi:Transport and Golgi organisation 2
MCTVTFVPSKDGCFITSSRDESISREKALPPAVHNYKGTTLVYPKDAKANGSWIAFTQTGNAAVLLNGAFTKHFAKPPYRKSRGLIFLDIIASPQPEFCFLGMNLDNIEPFTLVLFAGGFLFEARWDGSNKHFIQLDAGTAHIWSSATLYSPAVIDKRKQWFEQWLTSINTPTASAIFNFHRIAGDGDKKNSILMNRDDGMQTVSITCIDMRLEEATMQHFDLRANITSLISLQLEPVYILTFLKNFYDQEIEKTTVVYKTHQLGVLAI